MSKSRNKLGGRQAGASAAQKDSKKKRPGVKDGAATLRKLWSYISVYRSKLILIVSMVVVSSILGLLAPYLLGMSIDRLNEDRHLYGFITALAVVYVLHASATWIHNIGMIRVAQQVVFKLRGALFEQFHKLPIGYFMKRQHGELMSRATSDIDNVSHTLGSAFIQIFSSVITFVGMISLMLWLSPLLTLLTLTIVPVMFLGMRWITNRTGRFFKAQQQHLGELNGYVEETLSGQKIVKAYSREQDVMEHFRTKNEQLKAAGYLAQTYSGFIPKLMNMLNNFSFAVIACAGGLLVLEGYVSIGVIVTFAEYARQFTRPLNDLANQWNTFLSAIAGAERVFEVLEERTENHDEAGAQELETVRGEIEYRKVSFSYNEKQPILQGIEFKAMPGETVALVGPTGAGKTTIVQLLSRFFDPSEGSIRIDGLDTRQIRRSSLRRHMGFVLQDSFLFQGTIRDNIRYGKLDAADEEVEHAAKLANAHSFIMKLPQQYDTVLHQDGSGISQGQKQLLSIARAILANPSILILDEATSSIDTITEMKIQEALTVLMKGRTSVVIAHRLNTIQNADQILVLEEGRIIERGTHSSLLQQRGAYYQLVKSQYKEGLTAG